MILKYLKIFTDISNKKKTKKHKKIKDIEFDRKPLSIIKYDLQLLYKLVSIKI